MRARVGVKYRNSFQSRRRGATHDWLANTFRAAGARVSIPARKIAAARARGGLKNAQSRNVLRRTGSTQLRQRLITQRRSAAFTLSFITRRASSPRTHTRVTAHGGERVRAYARAGTADINNTLADVGAADMSSENPLTVTLSVSSLNLNRSRSYGRRVRWTRRSLFPLTGSRDRDPRLSRSRSYLDAFAPVNPRLSPAYCPAIPASRRKICRSSIGRSNRDRDHRRRFQPGA